MPAAKGALPLGFDPLAAGGDDQQPGPLAQLLSQVGRNPQDENLAIAAGMGMPGQNWTPGGALTGAIKADSDYRLERDKLMGQYVPLIQESMAQQYRSSMFQQMMDAAKQQQAMDAMTRLYGAQGQQSSAGVGGGVPVGGMPGMPQSSGTGSGFVGGLSPDMVAMFQQFGGVDFMPMWKQLHEGFKHEAGSYVDMPGQGMTYFPKISENMIPDGKGGVKLASGAAEEQARAAGLTTGAQEAAKDPFAKPEVVNTPQGPRLMTPAQQRAYANAQSPNAGGAKPSMSPADVAATVIANAGSGQEVMNALSGIAQRTSQDFADQVGSIVQQSPAWKMIAQNSPQASSQPAPAAASGSGGALRTPEQQKYADQVATDMAGFKKALDGNVEQGSNLNMRLQEQLDALQKFKAGGGGETRAELASMAQAIPGMPKSIVNGIAGGDIASMQEFNKLAAQTAMEQLKQSMGGSGRVSQMEFKVFLHNNPNLSTDPDAIRKIFDFNNRIFQRDVTKQSMYNAYVGKGGDPATFPQIWEEQSKQMGFTNPSMNAQATPVPGGSPPKIKDDVEFSKLPSGAVFVGPDGKQRRKP